VLVLLVVGFAWPVAFVDRAVAAGPGQYGNPEWLPLRHSASGGAFKVSCVLNNCSGNYHGYWALDLSDPSAQPGAPVFAAGAGQVTTAIGSYHSCGGSGTPANVVTVNHGGGVVSRYLHLNTVVASVGQWVDESTQIGTVGSVGYTDPCPAYHLHYERRLSGTYTDPGPLKACHGASLVTYPAAVGYGSWNSIPFLGAEVSSDSASCDTPPQAPSDDDNDGLPDTEDRCPSQVGPGGNGGCEPARDLCVLYDTVSSTGNTELHCTSASSGYQTPNVATVVGPGYIDRTKYQTYMADIDADGKADLCMLYDTVSSTHNTELHCQSASSGYQTPNLAIVAGPDYIDRTKYQTYMADVDADGKADLCVLYDTVSSTGNTELHCTSASSGYQTPNVATVVGPGYIDRTKYGVAIGASVFRGETPSTHVSTPTPTAAGTTPAPAPVASLSVPPTFATPLSPTMIAPTPPTTRDRRLAILMRRALAPSASLRRNAVLLAHGASLRLTVPTAGKVAVRWYTPRRDGRSGPDVLVAAGQRIYKTGAQATIRIRLTTAGRRLFRSTRRIRIQAHGSFTPRGGRTPVAVTASFAVTR